MEQYSYHEETGKITLEKKAVQNSENACGFSQSTPRVLQRSSDILVGLITFLPSPHLVYHAHDP